MGQRAGDVRRLEAHVVQPLAALGEEAAHRRGRAQRLQQLDLAVAGGEQRGLHTLLGDLRLAQQGQSEHVAIERVRIGETLHHDSNVMNPSNHLSALLVECMDMSPAVTLPEALEVCKVQPSLNRRRTCSSPSGGTAATPAFSSTCAVDFMPTSAVPTPGVERTNWMARWASVAKPGTRSASERYPRSPGSARRPFQVAAP